MHDQRKTYHVEMYRGYEIRWSTYENCYYISYGFEYRILQNVMARREKLTEAKMYVDDILDGTDKELEYELAQMR